MSSFRREISYLILVFLLCNFMFWKHESCKSHKPWHCPGSLGKENNSILGFLRCLAFICFHPYLIVLFLKERCSSPSPHTSAPSSSGLKREHTLFWLCSSLPPCTKRHGCVWWVLLTWASYTGWGAELQAEPWGKQEWWHRAACSQPQPCQCLWCRSWQGHQLSPIPGGGEQSLWLGGG